MQSVFILTNACEEEYLSRLDPALLSQQSLMEMLFDGLEDKDHLNDENGNFTECEDWEAVECDEKNNIIALNAGDFTVEVKGTVNFHFLPSTVRTVYFDDQRINGTVDTESL